jgi:hypothetical protein
MIKRQYTHGSEVDKFHLMLLFFGLMWIVGGSRIHSCVIPFGSLHNTDRVTLEKEAVKMVFVCSMSMVVLL